MIWCEFGEIINNTFFHRTSPVAASGIHLLVFNIPATPAPITFSSVFILP